MKPIRTVIIDDERYACDRLNRLLSSFSQISVIGIFTNSVQGMKCILKQKPDLVFMDVELEHNISSFELIDQLKDNYLPPYIILVTAFSQYSIKAIKNEIFDYLLKPVDIDELKVTISRLDNSISVNSSQIQSKFNMLTEREAEVLKSVLEGKNSREIADLLFLSINTVHTHRRNILKKTGARNIVDLLRIKRIPND